MSSDSHRLRLSMIGIVAFSLFAALFARLWYLQVMANDDFRVAARTNSTREVAIEAPRGRILDRNGNVIVDNRISIQVTIDRSALKKLSKAERERVLGTLADQLSRTSAPKTIAQIEQRIDDERYSPFVPVPIAGDVPESLKIWLDEHAREMPSVAAERVAVRDYPYGKLAAHVIGYTGKVKAEDLEAVKGTPIEKTKPYSLNDEIGRSGIEREYEAELRGTPGRSVIEVDAQGNPIRVVDDEPPIPGDDIQLNLDINLQAVAEQALKSGLDRASKRPAVGSDAPNVGRVGATVVIDPNSGGVLALASFPTFNPAEFVDGISNTEWAFLQDPANYHPLINRALQGQYAPGSTLKPFSASAGLTAGLLQPHSSINDQGVYTIPSCRGEPRACEKYNDGKKKYGQVDLQRSLTVSSDVYYYGLGAQFWLQRDELEAFGGEEAFRKLLGRWGFDQETGIDLPGEKEGRIGSKAWKTAYCKEVAKRAPCVDTGWFTGDNVNVAVGQGYDLVTPVQLASAYAALGNGGQRYQPQVARAVLDGVTHEVKHTFDPHPIGDPVEISAEGREQIIQGLIGVTTREGGTAVGAFSGFPNAAYPVAAKTGTAQVAKHAPTAVFGAFAPATAPQYAVAVLLEESGYGGSVAAPVARRIFDVLSDPSAMPDARATLEAPEAQLAEGGDVRD